MTNITFPTPFPRSALPFQYDQISHAVLQEWNETLQGAFQEYIKTVQPAPAPQAPMSEDERMAQLIEKQAEAQRRAQEMRVFASINAQRNQAFNAYVASNLYSSTGIFY
jgi:hypothetical protein